MNDTRIDLSNLRSRLEGDSGYRFCLADCISEVREIGGLASSAHAFVGTGVQCLLVGLSDPAAALFEKAEKWLELAIATDERPQPYFPDGTEAMRLGDLALCRWLSRNRHDQTTLLEAATASESYLRTDKVIRDSVAVGLSLWVFVDAGLFEKVIAICSEAQINMPASTSRLRGEASMSLVLASSALQASDIALDLEASRRSFLKHNVTPWIRRGQTVRLGAWCKTLLWDRSAVSSPANTVRKILEYI